MLIDRNAMKVPRTLLPGLVAILFCSACSALSAQQRTELTDARMPGECQRVAALLRTEGISRSNSTQMNTLYFCERTAGTVLPDAWDKVGADSLQLQTLIYASSNMRDGRIASRLEAILLDESKPSLVRQAVGVVLTGYLTRRPIVAHVTRSPSESETWYIGVVNNASDRRIDGTVPIESGFRERLRSHFAGLAISPATRSSPAARVTTFGKLCAYLLTIIPET